MPGVTKELHWQGTEPSRYAILTYTHTQTHTHIHTRVSCKLTAYTHRGVSDKLTADKTRASVDQTICGAFCKYKTAKIEMIKIYSRQIVSTE